jgi:hypothetical protein
LVFLECAEKSRSFPGLAYFFGCGAEEKGKRQNSKGKSQKAKFKSQKSKVKRQKLKVKKAKGKSQT